MVAHALLASSFLIDNWWAAPTAILTLALPVFFISRRAPAPSAPPTPEEPPANRFVSRRRQGALLKVALSWMAPADASLPASGWVFNRSTGGLRLTVGTTVESGTRLRVRPCNTSDATLGTLVQVRDCRKEGGCWILDCRFVESATASV